MHLRICLGSGYVRCRDDSVNRHARGHAEATGHAIAGSIEPGERLGWRHPDELDLLPRD